MASIKRNFVYNFILTIANYIFPLLVFPYVSRVLGVEGIGICEFVDNVINYYILFSMMGINVLGIREIANVKNEKHNLSKTFTSLFVLNGLITIIVLMFLISSIYFIPEFYEHKDLMWVGVCKVFFNFFVIEWFYKGMEDFEYITKRTIIVKCLFVLSVFVFVRDRTDYGIYYLLTVLMLLANAIINTVHRYNFVKIKFRDICLLKYVKPNFMLAVYQLLTSLYTTFNVIYLGFVVGTEQVGFFSVASKIVLLALGLFTAFSSVMLPRMSAILSKGCHDDFNVLVNKSFRILLLFSVPIIIVMEVFAVHIVAIIAGDSFEASVTMLRVLSPLIFICGFEQLLIWEIMMPQRQDKKILIFSAIGALVGIMLNVLLVRTIEGNGSSVSWTASEFTIMCLALYNVGKTIKINFPLKELFVIIGLSIPCVSFAVFLSSMEYNKFIILFVGTLFTVSYFGYVYLYIVRDNLVIQIRDSIINKLK